ncbi:MAG: hypothetical protein M1282_12735 [Chloroflexi bacterium]|nr:hypothetical protein [Chloroflexota bacterium]
MIRQETDQKEENACAQNIKQRAAAEFIASKQKINQTNKQHQYPQMRLESQQSRGDGGQTNFLVLQGISKQCRAEQNWKIILADKHTAQDWPKEKSDRK